MRRLLPVPYGAVRSNAALAQLVEHLIRNEGVTGSSPVSGTTSKTSLCNKNLSLFREADLPGEFRDM